MSLAPIGSPIKSLAYEQSQMVKTKRTKQSTLVQSTSTKSEPSKLMASLLKRTNHQQ